MRVLGGSQCDLRGHKLRHNSSVADRMEGRGWSRPAAAAVAAVWVSVCVCVPVCEGNNDEAGQLE